MDKVQSTIEEMVTAEQLAQLEKHLQLVITANETTNITRITSPEEARILHIEDSLVGLPEVMEAPAGLYGDMGTGAGFPGIPLAIMTGRKTVLIESVGKKTAILDGFIEELGLGEIASTFTGRLEDLALERRASFAVLTARALSQTGSLMELAAPLLRMGGRLVCYKAQPEEEEIVHAQSLQKTLGLKMVSRRDVVLSDGVTKRCIIVFEKVGNPTVRLPRRVGLAQRKPL